jgi:type II secretory pathway component PulJ
MKGWSRKISAFTISEMLVVLVISNIVISLALVVLNLVQQQISGVQKNAETKTEINLLEHALWKDFNSHEVVITKNREIICISEVDTVMYLLNDDVIIRNKDTIHTPVKKIEAYLDGNLVNGTSPIDALHLTIQQHQVDQNIFIFKTKDAAFYMNNEF